MLVEWKCGVVVVKLKSGDDGGTLNINTIKSTPKNVHLGIEIAEVSKQAILMEWEVINFYWSSQLFSNLGNLAMAW